MSANPVTDLEVEESLATPAAAAAPGKDVQDLRDSSSVDANPSAGSRGPAYQPGRIYLLGFPLDALTEQQCIAHILGALAESSGGWVVTHNLDHLRRLHRDQSFAALCRDAELRVADGMPLVWASRIQGTPLPERVAGSSLIWTLTAQAARNGRSVFLLGGDGDTAEQAAATLKHHYPELTVAGTDPAPMGFDSDARQFEQLKRQLRQASPDIVFVALGSPKQEVIIQRLREAAPTAWWMGVGISFSFVCGDVIRAPRWIQRLGLEWMHRMAQEPGRLWRRYLFEGIPFALRLIGSAGWKRMRPARQS